jgi:hypothetical protein
VPRQIRQRSPRWSGYRSAALACYAYSERRWLPTALLPRYGVEWRAEDEDHLAADVPIAGEHVTLQITVVGDGLVRSAHMDRWGDPDGTGTFGWFPFGIEVGASRPFACGITMPAEGVGGWFHGMDRWHDGEFFRYTIDEVTLVSCCEGKPWRKQE